MCDQSDPVSDSAEAPAIGTAWLPTTGEAAWNQSFRRTVQQIDEFGLVHFVRSDGECTTPLVQWIEWKRRAAVIEVCKDE